MKKALALLSFISIAFVIPVSADDKQSWRAHKADSVIIIQLSSGRVVIELAPQFAPKHVANIKQLVSDGYFDGTAIIRSQDNYVVQWGDPNAELANAKSISFETIVRSTFNKSKAVMRTPTKSVLLMLFLWRVMVTELG